MAEEEARESIAGRLWLGCGGLLAVVGPIWLIATVAFVSFDPSLAGVTYLIDGQEVTIHYGWLELWVRGGLKGALVVLAASPLLMLFGGLMWTIGVVRARRAARERERYDRLVQDEAVLRAADWSADARGSERTGR